MMPLDMEDAEDMPGSESKEDGEGRPSQSGYKDRASSSRITILKSAHYGRTRDEVEKSLKEWQELANNHRLSFLISPYERRVVSGN